MKELILSLIQEAQALVSNETIAPHDLSSLKSLVIQLELAQELEILAGLVESGDDFEAAFRARCKARAIQNDGTCLSFTEMPEATVNQLYWDIASLLVPKPQTLGAMLSILMPQVHEKIVPDYILQKDMSNGRLLLKNVKFKSQTTAQWEEDASLKRLGDFVIAGTKLFDVNDISLLRFNFHLGLHESLISCYPELAARLYKHNPSLRILADRVSILQGKGQTPFEAISVFIRDLLLSGTHMTGMQYAEKSAGIAFVSFMGYLEILPAEIKASLLALTSPNGESIAGIIDDLRRGNCIETAASELQYILEHSTSRDLLNSRPLLPDNYVSKIVKEYVKDGIATKALESSNSLPECFLEEALSQVVIDNSYDCLSLLLSFSPSQYLPLLKYARIDFRILTDLSYQIRDGVLNEEQKRALFAALFNQYQKFRQCIPFYITSGGTVEDLMPLLGKLPKDYIFGLMQERRQMGYHIPLIQKLISKPEFLSALLLLFPESDRFLLVNGYYDIYYVTPLYLAASYPDSLRILLSLYPKNERLAVLNTEKEHFGTVFSVAASYPKSLLVIIESLSEVEQIEVLKDLKIDGSKILHHIAANPTVLNAILALYPPEDRLLAVKERDSIGNTVLHKAVTNYDSLKLVLSLYPDSELLTVAKEKNMAGYNLLRLSITIPESFVAVLALYPAAERIKAVEELEINGEIMLHKLVYNPRSFIALLEVYPENQRLNELRKKDRLGRSVLYNAVIYPATIAAIMQSLPEKDRAAARAEMRGYTDYWLWFLKIIAAFPLFSGSYLVAMAAHNLTLSAVILLSSSVISGPIFGLVFGVFFFSIGHIFKSFVDALDHVDDIDLGNINEFLYITGINIAVGIGISTFMGFSAASVFLLNRTLFSVAGYNALAYGATIAGAGIATTIGFFSKSMQRQPHFGNAPGVLQDDNDAVIPIPAV